MLHICNEWVMRLAKFLPLAALLAAPLRAQDPSATVFDRSALARIDLSLPPDSLRRVLDNPYADHEVPATFTYTRGPVVETVETVGLRIRGNTSRAAQKKSFKISMNTFVRGRAWRGLEKLNLNGEHNDPSLVRSTLAWTLFADEQLVASRAAPVELYFNGTFYGVYTNVEHLDETFLARRFGSPDGDLFKCLYPADLAFRGTDGSNYVHRDGSGRIVYEWEQGADSVAAYNRLAGFIQTLNQTSTADFPARIEDIFDVNAFLHTLAVDVVTGSWDDYWYNQNNFYLRFDPETGRVTYVPYDYDNSYGVDWVGRDWGTRNPYTWGTGTRPLASRILAVPAFRARYTFYLRKLLNGAYAYDRQTARMDSLRTLLDAAAVRDTFRTKDYGFTVVDFRNAATVAWGGHVKYGLKPFVQTRRQSLLTALDATNTAPIVHLPAALPRRPTTRDSLTVTVRVEDEAAPTSVGLMEGTAAVPPLPMYDDGTHGDATPGDGLYTLRLAPTSAATRTFRATATDVLGQGGTSPVRTVTVVPAALGVVVNEFVASNNGAFRDPAGDADDWIELFNPTAAPVRLLGYTLTDNLAAPTTWAFPDTTLAAGAYLIVWADDEAAEGPLHASFKLGASGEAIGLFRDGAQVDAVVFGAQASGISTGRSPNGTGGFAVLPAITPGAANPLANARSDEPMPTMADAPRLFPTPFEHRFTLALPPSPSPWRVVVADALGREILRADLPGDAGAWTFDRIVPPGVYAVRVASDAAGVWRLRALRR